MEVRLRVRLVVERHFGSREIEICDSSKIIKINLMDILMVIGIISIISIIN